MNWYGSIFHLYKLLTVDGWEGEKLKEEDERLVLRRDGF